MSYVPQTDGAIKINHGNLIFLKAWPKITKNESRRTKYICVPPQRDAIRWLLGSYINSLNDCNF